METELRSDWPAASRLFFKFLLIYILLYGLPLTFLYQDVVLWFGRQFLGVEGTINTSMTGSGDMTYNWLIFWFNLFLTLAGTLTWTAADRNKKSYPRLAEVLYVFTRYYLGFVLLGYGFSKVIPTQFSLPGFIRLTQEFGASSPMGLAWTFMGFSTGYQIFAGLMEVIGGFLLLFRRTVLMGALISTGVMTNVFMINMFFDVPVKLFSGHLLLFSVGLAALHLRPLWDFFIMHRAARQNVRPFPFKDRGWIIISYTIKGLLITGLVITQIYFVYSQYSARPDPPAIAGIYHVQEFSINGNDMATNPQRWNRVVIDNRHAGSVAIDYITGDRVRFNGSFSTESNSMRAEVPHNPRIDSAARQSLEVAWNHSAENLMVFQGTLGGDSLSVQLKKLSKEDLLLISRGFNWVNERPYNR